MKDKKILFPLVLSLICFVLFIVEIILVCCFDVQAIGPLDSSVGFATVNQKMRSLIGFDKAWYNISEALGILSILCAVGFAAFGAYRLIKTKKLSGVGNDIIALGIVFVLSAVFYVVFEIAVVNYRPILVEGELEASFPSSHTMLAVSVLGCAAEYFFESKLKNVLRFTLHTVFNVVLILLVVSRLLSGVHWFTDIVGGITLGLALVFLYCALSKLEIVKSK